MVHYRSHSASATMHRTLWLIILATVCEAFYDDYDLYMDNERTDTNRQKDLHAHFMDGNFTEDLRKFASEYMRQEKGEVLTYSKAKSRLQSIKVLTFMSTSKDFNATKMSQLPLENGSRYCSRYRQTVVGCNHCVCVAGQLYLCTGAICPKSSSNKQLLRAQHLKCRDGDTRMDKDGCNRCICIQNTEYCTGQPCIPPLNLHENMKTTKQHCRSGTKRMSKDGCNRCICIKNTVYCTRKRCQTKSDRKCPTGAIKEGVCGTCMCIRGKWICHYCKDESEESRLFLTKTDKNDPDQNCKPGTIKENKCGKCFCLKSRWICGNCAEKKNKKKRYKIKKRQMKLSQPKNPECYGKRGEWFMDDDGCNSCTCINNKKLCTRLLCLRSQKVSGNTNQALGVSRRSLGRQCVDGTRYKIDPCNYCMCVYGQDVCTDINCAATDLDGVVCDPYKHVVPKKVDCNVCHCSKSSELMYEGNIQKYRWLWFCTKRKCDSYNKKTSKMRKPYVMSVPCKEGNTRQIDNCNRCTCEKGLYVCTDEICEIDRINILRRKQNCDLWQVKYKKCNRCICVARKYVCTKRICAKMEAHNIFDDDEYLEEFYDSVSLEELTDKESDSSDIYNDIDFDTSSYFKDKEPDTSSYFKIKEFGNIFKDVFHIFRARGDTQDGPPSSTPLSWIFSPSQPNTDSQVVTPPSWQTYNNETSVEVLRLLGDYDGQTVVVDPTHRSGQDQYLRVNNDKIDTKNTKHCNVGERYRLGACNYCYCNELGIRICTRHSCDSHGTELPDSEYIPKEYETECKIGVRFRLDKCNYCYCNAHRQLICSKNKCPSSNDQAPYLRSPFEEDCEEGHVLADSCVICTCTANKTYVCIPEKTEDCDMPIHTNILPQVRANDDSCIDGSQRQKDACNYCICINGIEMCTQKPCLDNVPNVSVMIEKDCVDGEVHSTYDGCNVCVCMNGKIACTNKGCLQVLRRGLKPLDLVRSLLQSLYSQSQIPPQMLEPGCNKEMLYLPEDYDPECHNVCLCDGNELFCTHRQCDKTHSKIHEPKRLESKGVKQNTHKADVTFCKPFTFFSPDGNRFCRNCFCLHNGLALCLLNLCKEDTPHKTINTKPGKMLRKYCREKDKFQMGFPPYCAQCKCLSNQWDCSVKGESCSDYSDVKCPFGTLIQNPRQRCSICLCGGYKPGSHNLCFTEERCVETLNKHTYN